MDADIVNKEERQLLDEKYGGNAAAPGFAEDKVRLAKGEPLAYVIGWQPFLGLRIYLDTKPLIPRPETEWWSEELVKHLREKFGEKPFALLDLCAGSGAIGLAVLAAFPAARVSFGELDPKHAALIGKNIRENGLDAARADVRAGDLFSPFGDERFDIIATNPPYIPLARVLDASVIEHEPHEALYAGPDGLDIIRDIAEEASVYLLPEGEIWMECDIDNAGYARDLLETHATVRTELREDQYSRPRLAIGYY